MDTNYVQNEQENVQTNVIQNKKPDNLCRAGCIIAIVISSLALIGFSIGGLILLVTGTMSYGFYMVTGIFYLIIAGIEIIPIIMCDNVLKGKAESNRTYKKMGFWKKTRKLNKNNKLNHLLKWFFYL
ncbi:hypothetical protein [Spiroplasma sp. ald]|uniref:hypothetical protein n=1 Tax=Spiroplasma sp. ald TaxID=2490849 RepID=UPI0037DD4150